MKTYQERTQNISAKAKGIASRRKAWITAASTLCLVAIICSALFIPYYEAIDFPGFGLPDISAFKGDKYFSLIEKINNYNGKHGQYWDLAVDEITSDSDMTPTAPGSADGSAPETNQPPTSSSNYEETTLNQVQGVIEGDIVKRTTTHAFSLRRVFDTYYYGTGKLNLRAYSLNKDQSELVGEYTTEIDSRGFYVYGMEMYLSEDGTLATIFSNCNKRDVNGKYDTNAYTCILSLDISNPADIKEISCIYIAGMYKSSRKVNGEFLVVTNFQVPRVVDFNNKFSFIPSVGTDDDMEYLDLQEIYIPENVSTCNYTVIAKVQENGLEVTDKQALFSFTSEVAVSTEHIFVTRNGSYFSEKDKVFYDSDLVQNQAQCIAYTDIVALTYKDKIETVGCVQVDGSIKDRYSLDEKDGILRVATTTWEHKAYCHKYTYLDETYQFVSYRESVSNASLYCIDLQSMEIVASKEKFAPQGETVQSARFDGDIAYICTAVRFTDPVFAFDLSDLNNITVKDTGTISGYSISLLPFGDNLLGIGFGEMSNELKIELYQETENGVQSVDSYIKSMCNFSSEYKAHFVDAERQLVGLMVYDYSDFSDNNGNYYLLLHFNGEHFEVVLFERVAGEVSSTRAFYADGLYVLTEADQGISYFDIDAIMQNLNNQEIAE